MIKDITDRSFKRLVEDNRPAIAYFTASWCTPCKRLSPLLEELSTMIKVPIYKLDIDNDRLTPMRHGVMAVPTLLYFQDGYIKRLVNPKTKSVIIEAFGLETVQNGAEPASERGRHGWWQELV